MLGMLTEDLEALALLEVARIFPVVLRNEDLEEHDLVGRRR